MVTISPTDSPASRPRRLPRKYNVNASRNSRPEFVSKSVGLRRARGLDPEMLDAVRKLVDSQLGLKKIAEYLCISKVTLRKRLAQEGYEISNDWLFDIVPAPGHEEKTVDLLAWLFSHDVPADVPKDKRQALEDALTDIAKHLDFPSGDSAGLSREQLLIAYRVTRTLHRGAQTVGRILGTSTPVTFKRLSHMGLSIVNFRTFRLVPIPADIK